MQKKSSVAKLIILSGCMLSLLSKGSGDSFLQLPLAPGCLVGRMCQWRGGGAI